MSDITTSANYSDILPKYIELQRDIMFDHLIDIPSGTLVISECDESPVWNQALIKQDLSLDEIPMIEKEFEKYNRNPAIYFQRTGTCDTLIRGLTDRGYSKSFEDCWNFYPLKEIDSSRFHQVRKVETTEDLELFLETFDKCYQDNDPQNPYGSLGNYINIARTSWEKHNSDKLDYFIAFEGNKAVAVSSLTYTDSIGYISNVGSLVEVRGNGYGKLITLFAIDQARKHGPQEVFLLTEEGCYPNEFYKRIGFVNKFKAVCYAK